MPSLLKLPNTDTREWYFVFHAPQRALPWWMRLFVWNSPPHLQHCLAFCQMGKFLLFVEPTMTGVTLTTKYDENDINGVIPAEGAVLIFKDQGWTVVRHKFAPCMDPVKHITNCVPTCVSAVKGITGFNCHALTPKGLLIALLRDGAEML